MTRHALTLAILALLPVGAACAQDHGIEMIDTGKVRNGFLWTSTFQRADGITCAWIEVIDSKLTGLIYDTKTEQCRKGPPAAPTARFEYSGTSGDRITFGGADFDVVKNSKSQISGSWNHVSFNPGFDIENVVFRALPIK